MVGVQLKDQGPLGREVGRQSQNDKPADWGDYPRFMLRRWKEHKLIRGSNKIACLDCGKFSATNKRDILRIKRGWLTEPCAGIKKMPSALKRLIDAGEFDGERSSRALLATNGCA